MIQLPKHDAVVTGPELTPLIDIIFIVAVFLLLTANTRLVSLPVDMPETDSDVSPAIATQRPVNILIQTTQPHWVLDIAHAGTYQFEEWEDFKSSLLSRMDEPNTQIFIVPEAQADAELLLKLLAFLGEQNFDNAQLLMKPLTH